MCRKQVPLVVTTILFCMLGAPVVKATVASAGVYRGGQPRDATTFNTGPLKWGRTYYWRVDEVNEAEPSSP